MELLSPRVSNSCTGTKLWYVCSAGNFRGCCSSDPCTTGVCPDDDSTTSTSTSTSTSMTSDSSKSTLTSSDSSTSTPMSSDSSMSTSTRTAETTSLTSILSVSTTSTPTSAPTSEATKSTNTAAIIGGVLGAVAGLVICVLLIWFCCRRKRRAKLDVKFHRSVSTQAVYDQDTSSAAKKAIPPPLTNTRRFNGEHATEPLLPRNPDIDDISDSLSSPPHPTPSTTGSHADTTTSFVGSLSSGMQVPSIGSSQRATETDISSLSPMSTSQIPPTPRIKPNGFLAILKRTDCSELSDTGVYRQRAELASHSQSELINVSRDQRLLSPCQLRHEPGSRSLDPISSPGATDNRPTDMNVDSPNPTTRETRRRVITDDGVVLSANFDRYSVPIVLAPEPENGILRGPDSDHVMSFMNYDRGRLPEMMERPGAKINEAARNVTFENCASPMSDILPAYESGGFLLDDKTPAGTVELGKRGC